MNDLQRKTLPNFTAVFLSHLALVLFLGNANCWTAHGQPTSLAYEGFNYTNNSLAGQNGGSGWSSPWTHTYLSGANLMVSSTGLTYPGLSATGGSVVWGSGGNGISEDSRSLPLVDSGVVYFEFLGQFGSSSGGGTPNIRLLHSGTLTGGFGGNGGPYGSRMSILDSGLNAVSDGSSTSFASLSSLNYVVGRIDYQNDNTSLWVNPNLSLFDYANPGTPDASYAGLAPIFDSIQIITRSPGNVDEISILSEDTPEPSTIALFVMGVGILYAVRRFTRSKGARNNL